MDNLKEFEEEYCSICYENIPYKQISCGHSCCYLCFYKMINIGTKNCHMCRTSFENDLEFTTFPLQNVTRPTIGQLRPTENTRNRLVTSQCIGITRTGLQCKNSTRHVSVKCGKHQ
jgi:hypothetical protein